MEQHGYHDRQQIGRHGILAAGGSAIETYSLVAVANGISSDPVTFTPTSLPDLEVSSEILSGGNNNGIIDYDECNSLSLALTNVGSTYATTVFATLSTTTPGVTIAQPTSLYPNIVAAGVGTNLTAFKISTSPSFVCGTPVVFSLVVKSDQVITTNQFTLSSGTPGLPVRFDNNSTVIVPDNAPQGTNSTIMVNNINSVLMGVTVSLNILQSEVGDLTLLLVGPDGTTSVLSQNNGGFGQNYGFDCNFDGDRTTFDDNSQTSIDAGTPPFVGTFQPDTPLSVFKGKSGNAVNGAWQLQVLDPFSDFTGSIQCWSLVLTPAACTDGEGQCPGVDLVLGMTAVPESIMLGSSFTYLMSVTNNGPNTATEVTLSQTLPSSVQLVSTSSSQGVVSTNGGIVSCSIGTLAVGASATVGVVVFPTSVGTVFSTATVGAQQIDINIANNTVTVGEVVQAPSADLSVGLAASPNPALVGGVLNYTVSVTNNGPSTASGVVVTNILPPGVGVISASSSQGVSSSVSNLVICSLGTLLQGSNATANIQVRALTVGTIAEASSATATSGRVL